MRERHFIVLILLLVPVIAAAQSTFIKTYGGAGVDQLMHPILKATGGGYCFGGTTKSYGAGAEDILVLKTDTNGMVQWTRAFGGAAVDFCHSIAHTYDGGYIASGWTNSFANGYEAVLLKVSGSGAYQWMRTYGWSSSNEYSFSVVQSPDSGYAFLGQTSTGRGDILFVKTDVRGDVRWARIFGDTAAIDQGKLLLCTRDGGYLLLSRAASFSAGGKDYLLIKTDGRGDVQWSKTYGGKLDENVYDIIQTKDSGYVICGRTLSFGNGNSDALIVKLSAEGAPQWARTYGDTAFDDFSNSIIQTPDGGYATSGHTKSFGAGMDECSLMKIDSLGALQWIRTFGGPQMDENLTLLRADDGGYVLNGFTASYGAGNRDGILMKTDVNGRIGTCVQSIATNVRMGTPSLIVSSPTISGTVVFPSAGSPAPTITSPVITMKELCSTTEANFFDIHASPARTSVYPNPFSKQTTISMTLLSHCHVTLEVFDLFGHKLATLVDEEKEAGEHRVTFDPGRHGFNVASGMYVYQLRSGGTCLSKMLTIVH